MEQVAAMTLDDAAPVPAEGSEPQLSKKQLKKLAKGKGPKKDKPKPTWGPPGEGKKKKEKEISSAIALPKKDYVNDTPKGEKKRMGEMEEAYHPAAVESAWQDWWEARSVIDMLLPIPIVLIRHPHPSIPFLC